MSRRKKEKFREGPRREPRILIRKETKRILVAVVAAAFGAVLVMAQFGLAGPAGNFIFTSLSFLMGWEYALLPAAFFITAIAFLRGIPSNAVTLAIGLSLAVLSVLGISHEIEPYSAGLVGQAIASISAVFGFWASLVILGAAGICGLFIAFHARVPRPKTEAAKLPVVNKVEQPSIVSQSSQSKPDKPSRESQTRGRPELDREEESALPVIPKVLLKDWDLPPLDLLESDTSKPTAGDVRINANIIKRTLENFGIPVEMAEINVGPTVTQYTLKPAEGVKLAKIVVLQNDLALSLAAHPIRIEAPIPGKSLVGIEVPNKAAAVVRMRTLFADAKFFDERSPLAFLLGRDVMGAPITADLSRMPHLLIAGATGSGKSIFIHSVLSSFLFRNPPHLLRLILIDPKRVELSQYQGIPHLLTPVITEGKRAVNALKWAIKEMDRRYALLLGAHARDIFSYNTSRGASPEELLPFIVIFIDELADLMAAYGREIEGAIVRLAQMARATGIHLVVSTQRPSVEVITGLIKANITSRVAFQVASQVDSRTILDMAGAEKLLGFGDMLFLAPDASKPRRIQAPFVADRETKRVVEFLTVEGDTLGAHMPETLDAEDVDVAGENTEGDLEFEGEDSLYDEALRVVREAKKASASLLQRRLKVGYARAARLLDIMEARGMVGPGEGAKPREVFGIKEDHYRDES